MAAGDVTVFSEFMQDIGEEIHDFSSDTIKLGLITASVTPDADTGTPRWDGTSTQDYDGNQVSTGGAYPNDGITVPVTFSRTDDTITLDDDDGDINLDPDPLGFTNARWGILYNATTANKNCICFIDFGEDCLDETAGAVRIYWNTNGIFTISAI